MTAPDELAELRRLLAQLDSGDLSLRRAGENVTRPEADVLRREIARLEILLARARAGARKA